MRTVMDIGVFQLLPRGRAATDREVVEQALWEVDFAERHGFESIWVTEHHFSGYGSIGVPSVYAAGIAQRTRRIRIGYGVAVVPLHHPLRLAEEIALTDQMIEGRLEVWPVKPSVKEGVSPCRADGRPTERQDSHRPNGHHQEPTWRREPPVCGSFLAIRG